MAILGDDVRSAVLAVSISLLAATAPAAMAQDPAELPLDVKSVGDLSYAWSFCRELGFDTSKQQFEQYRTYIAAKWIKRGVAASIMITRINLAQSDANNAGRLLAKNLSDDLGSDITTGDDKSASGHVFDYAMYWYKACSEFAANDEAGKYISHGDQVSEEKKLKAFEMRIVNAMRDASKHRR
jgi:hypothetical protein